MNTGYYHFLTKENLPKDQGRKFSMHEMGTGFVCGECGRTYKLKSSLRNHKKWECGKEPSFKCDKCEYKAKQKMHLLRHMQRVHREELDGKELNGSFSEDTVPHEKIVLPIGKITGLVHNVTVSGGIVIERSQKDVV